MLFTFAASAQPVVVDPCVDPKPPEPVIEPFSVYPGCENVDLSTYQFKRKIYIDPVNGKNTNDGLSPETAFNNLNYAQPSSKKIKGGDHIVFLAGDHSSVTLNKYSNGGLVGNPDWIWFDFKLATSVGKVELTHISHVIITDAKSTSNMTVSTTQSIISRIKIGAKVKPSYDDPAAWMKLSGGFNTRNGHCVSVTNSEFKVLRAGIAASSDNAEYPANSVKFLFENNVVEEASADMIRGIASDIIIRKNKFTRGYVGSNMGDGNHDDMFQGFALGPKSFQNLLIEGNTMIDKMPEIPGLSSRYQGICIFDGLYKNVTIRKNIVAVSNYHGIAVYWGENVLIENNTVVGTGGKNTWIKSAKGKGGQSPANVVIRNNLAAKFTNTLPPESNNGVITKPQDHYVAFDPVNGVYDFHLKPTSKFYGKGMGALPDVE